MPRGRLRKRLRPETAVLLFISVLSAIPRLYYAAIEPVEYDGYWHVFIAMQQNWADFQREYQANFHPPLFYLLLKLALWFGHTTLVYRAVSLMAGIAAVFVAGKITSKVTKSAWAAAGAALACGLVVPAIEISCEVRSYMLSEFFVLASFFYFLDFANEETAGRSRVLFAAGAILACYSQYAAFFYVAACAVMAAAFTVTRRRGVLRRAALDVATFVPVAGALGYLFVSHAGAHAFPAGHLLPHYLQPGREAAWQFLLRNTEHLYNLFSPAPVRGGAAFAAVLILLGAAAAWTVYLIRDLRRPENTRAAALLAVTVLMLMSLMAGGLAGKYPYGGTLRHQFLIFPFLIVWGFILLDRAASLLPATAGKAVFATVLAATVAVTTLSLARAARPKPEVGAAQMARFQKLFPAPAAVYLDQFNLITYFLHHHDWNWKVVERGELTYTYDVRRPDKRVLVFRDMWRWMLDFADPALYLTLGQAIRTHALPSLAVFHMRETLSMKEEAALARQIVERASAADLCVQKLAVEGASVFAEFRDGRCSAQMLPVLSCTQCDDTSWSITYSGEWTRGAFEQAAQGSLTYTDQRGAAARFTFEGTALKYVYTKAFNRGLAAVQIDGAPQGTVDLYSPKIEWQSSTVFGGLQPGRHTVEIRVAGKHNPASSGNYVDIDALLSPR